MNRRKSLKMGASIIAGMAIVPGMNACNGKSEEEPVDSFWEVIKNRRSVRNFKSDPVPEEHLLKIVDAARMAPTAGNQQPWKFIIVQDKQLIDSLRNECIKRVENYLIENKKLKGEELKKELEKEVQRQITGRLSAPAYIVVLTDDQSNYPGYNKYDGPLAAGYLLLAARALGYGTVFLTDSISVEATKKVLNIPDNYTRVCITPVGVPVSWPEVEKKSLEDLIVRNSF